MAGSTTSTAGTTASASSIDERTLAVFFAVLTALVVGFTAVSYVADVSIVALGPLYMFTPGVAGVIACLHGDVALSDVGLRVGRRRWLALAAVLPVPVLGVITLLSLGVPGVTFNSSLDVTAELGLPSGLLWTVAAWSAIVVVGATLNAIFGFGEEFGWRGYMLWELAPLGFWKASFAVGAVWGVWHAPLIVAGHNYPAFPVVGVVAFTVVCTAMAPIYTYIVVRSKSVLPAAVFHGVFNAVGFIGYTATDDPVLRQLVTGEGGLVGVTVFALVALAIAVTGTPRLTREFASETTADSPDSHVAAS